MNKVIAVIAASGRSGQAFVHAALEAGYIVRAGYHGQDPFPAHTNLLTFRCDATSESDVRQLLAGSTIVVSLIGHIKGSPAMLQTDAMRTIIKVMDELGITRIISLTGTGVRMPGDTPSSLDRIMNFSIKFIDPERIEDGVAHARLLESTNLDWTILRVLKLTDTYSSNARVTLSLFGPAEVCTSRQKVAQAILQILQTENYVHVAPIVQ